jgi:hypothetical protein
VGINYIEKGLGLHAAIAAAGYNLQQINGVWVSTNDAAVQVIIDSYDVLPDVRKARIQQIRDESIVRISTDMPGISDVDQLEVILALWNSVRNTAQNATAKFQRLLDIQAAAKAGIAAVRAAQTPAAVAAVVVNWPV